MDVPDPFFLDDDTDDDAPLSRANSPAISQVHVSAASPSLVPPKAPTPNIVPTPKQYNIRGLRSPSLFLPIPSVRTNKLSRRNISAISPCSNVSRPIILIPDRYVDLNRRQIL